MTHPAHLPGSHRTDTRKRPARLWPAVIALLLCWCELINAKEADRPQPFSATYQASYNGLTVIATRALKDNGDGTMTLTSAVEHWLATLRESSQFRWDTHQNLQPLNYRYQRESLGNSRIIQQTFDWPLHLLTVKNSDDVRHVPIPDGTLDKLSYQLQLRQDLLNGKKNSHYQVADGHRLKTYNFTVVGKEVLQTPLGRLNTVKVKKVREDRSRQTLIWLASDWNYLVVKIQQSEDGEQDFEINLQSARVGDRAVLGLKSP